MPARRRSIVFPAAVAVACAAVVAVALLLAFGWGAISLRDDGGATTTVPGPAKKTIGASVEGRTIELYSLGVGSKRVLVIGGIHGDETGGEVARQLVAYLEENPQALPEGVYMAIVPGANPDGEVLGTRGNANGVDVNRNFPSRNWSERLNAGDRPTEGLTGGSAPGSEPETQALLAVLAEGWDLVIALHSYGGIIDFDGETGLAVAQRMSAASGLPVSHLDYQPHVTGSLGTYVPERYGVPVITVELEGATLTPGLRTALLTALE